MNELEKHSEQIKSEAQRLGFSDCGIAEVQPLSKEAEDLRQWLEENRHGEMEYMKNHFDKRTNPSMLVENARSVISVLLNYYPDTVQTSSSYKISKYAYGNDYHWLIKKKLHKLLRYLQDHFKVQKGRAFVDSAPVMDKVWAQKAGLGWIGKNTNLITQKFGSYVFIGELIVDIELAYDKPGKDRCGNCTRCLEACPTGALTDAKKIDASRCISYLTIEKKGALPEQLKSRWKNWIFGCDICQDVCPWNKNLIPHSYSELKPTPELFTMKDKDWEEMSREQFNKIFRNSAVKRTKFEGLKRNIHFVNKF